MTSSWCVLTVVVLGGCIDPDVRTCDGGYVCPTAALCDMAHHGCATPAQLAECDALADGDACSEGVCDHGVCIAVVCGDGIVEPPEVCDDGNTLAADGCSADCLSDETCGNGVRDPAEVCDDGNLASHDGCSSRCAAETVAYHAVPIAPFTTSAVGGVYDPARRVLVHLGGQGVTWELSPDAWTVGSLAGPPATSGALAYDPAGARTLLFASFGTRTLDGIAAWDGAHWTALATGSAGMSGALAAVYDPGRNAVVLVLHDGSTWTWDPGHGFTQLEAPGGFTDFFTVLAFDGSTNQVVATGLRASTASTWTLDPSGVWDELGGVPPEMEGAPLVYDRVRGHLVGIGATGHLLEEVAGSWSFVEDGPVFDARQPATIELGFDPQAQALVAFAAAREDDTRHSWWRADGATWADHTPPHPEPGAFAALGHRRFVVAGPDETWMWDGAAWQQGPATPASFPLLAFDPRRGAAIGLDPDAGTTWELAGSAWTELPVTTPTGQLDALGYDPSRGTVVAQLDAGVYALDVGAGAWAPIAPSPPLPSGQRTRDWLVYDATAGGLVAAFATGPGSLLAGSAWEPILAPQPGYGAAAAYRRRTVVFLPLSSTQPSWERAGAALTELPPPPVAMGLSTDALGLAGADGQIATDPIDDTIATFGSPGGGMLILERRYESATPDETCAAGSDADGDGLAGCADPDCALLCPQ